MDKFAAGKQITDFALSGYPATLPIGKISALIANVLPAHLYLLSPSATPGGAERSHLFLFNNKGAYEQAFILPTDLDMAESLALSDDGSSIWIGSHKAAYHFSLN